MWTAFRSGLSSWAGYEVLGISISPLLQQVATPEDFATHIDIADWVTHYTIILA